MSKIDILIRILLFIAMVSVIRGCISGSIYEQQLKICVEKLKGET